MLFKVLIEWKETKIITTVVCDYRVMVELWLWKGIIILCWLIMYHDDGHQSNTDVDLMICKQCLFECAMEVNSTHQIIRCEPFHTAQKIKLINFCIFSHWQPQTDNSKKTTTLCDISHSSTHAVGFHYKTYGEISPSCTFSYTLHCSVWFSLFKGIFVRENTWFEHKSPHQALV